MPEAIMSENKPKLERASTLIQASRLESILNDDVELKQDEKSVSSASHSLASSVSSASKRPQIVISREDTM